MKLTCLHTVENDWLDCVSKKDRVLFACSDAINLIGALRESILQLKETLSPRKYKAVISLASGSQMNCILEATTYDQAVIEADKISDDFEWSVVQSIHEISDPEVRK